MRSHTLTLTLLVPAGIAWKKVKQEVKKTDAANRDYVQPRNNRDYARVFLHRMRMEADEYFEDYEYGTLS
jgi:hypothetical protein